jgi:uncharacterized protein (DUF697 family)
VAKLPFDLTKTLKTLREASAKATEMAAIVLAGDPSLVERAREEFAVGGTIPAVATKEAFSGPAPFAAGSGELLVVFVKPDQEAEVEAFLARTVSRKSVILVVDGGPGTRPKAGLTGGGMTRLAFSDTEACWDRLFALCAEAAGDKGAALGRRYPVVRRAAARRLISKTALQNVLIALVFFMPGSDMPAMTLNQAKMVLNIAGMYGQPIDKERAIELAAMMGLGFGFRGVGRLLVRRIPGLAIIMRVVTAYAATIAVGLGAIAYFEKGAPVSTSKVIALAGSLRR